MLSKYLKCSVWRLAVRYDMYIYIYVIRRQRVNCDRIGIEQLEFHFADFKACTFVADYTTENVRRLCSS